MSGDDRRGLLVLLAAILAVTLVSSSVAAVTGLVGGIPVDPGQDGLVLDAAGGPEVTLTSQTEIAGMPFDGGTLTLGALNVTGPDDATLDVDKQNGSTTQVSNVDLAGGMVTLDPNDKPESDLLSGPITDLHLADPSLDDGQTDLSYEAGSQISVRLYGLAASKTIQAVAGGQTLTTTTTTASGTATLDLPSGDYDAVELVTASTSPPAVDLQSPADGELVGENVTLVAEVSDPDFDTATFEALDVEILVDGSVVSTETVSANTTVEYNVTGIAPGETRSWTVRVTDEQGTTVTAETRTFARPGQLLIRDETDPQSLINGTGVNVTVTFFGSSGSVVQRTVSDGTVNLTGLPTDERYVAQADADGYQSRRAYILSVREQQSLYLLPTDPGNTSTIQFVVEDQTGRFSGGETVLQVERALDPDGDGNFSFVTVSGGEVGATGTFTTDLETGARYRLSVRNEEGDTRVLGSYIPRGDDQVPLPIGQVVLDGDELEPGTSLGARLVETDQGQRVIRVQYEDRQNLTDSLTITVHRRGDETDVLVPGEVVDVTGETTTVTYQVPDDAPEDVSYAVDVTVNRDGETFDQTVFVGRTGTVGDGWGVPPNLRMPIFVVLTFAFAALGAQAGGAALGTFAATLLAFLVTVTGFFAVPSPLLGMAGVVTLLVNFNRR